MGELAKHIHSLRQKKGITVRALAQIVGKTPGYLSRVETRDEVPAPELICVIADALGGVPETLLDLAKHDLIRRTKQQIEKKSADALSLYRRSQ